MHRRTLVQDDDAATPRAKPIHRRPVDHQWLAGVIRSGIPDLIDA
jgi:hypothetical protein